MLYNNDKKVKRSYSFLLEPKSSEHLKKNQTKGQHIITKLQKKHK